jgi:hypothetical protein
MMSSMPEPTAVWMVHLARGESPSGVRGTLTIEDGFLVFTDRDLRPVRFHRSGIRRAKRVRGSPVLQLEWIEGGTVRRTAFYFVEPPPLITDRGAAPPPLSPGSGAIGGLGAIRRSSKRRQMRTNAGYLQTSGIDKRRQIQDWADEIAELLRGDR